MVRYTYKRYKITEIAAKEKEMRGVSGLFVQL